MLKLLLYNNLEGKGGQEGSGGRKNICISSVQFSSVQSLSRVRVFATPWIAARQASLSITNSRSLLKLMPRYMYTHGQFMLMYGKNHRSFVK